MKPILRNIIITFALAISSFCSLSSYAQVIVVLQQPPPYQFRVEHMWKLTLINPTQTTYHVSLRGVATELDEGRIVEATTTIFTLAPGTKVVNPRELAPINVKASNPKYTYLVSKTGSVLTGDYDICVSVINMAYGVEIGTGCVSVQVQHLTQVELLGPENGTVFTHFGGSESVKSGMKEAEKNEIHERTATGSFLIFNWFPPSPIHQADRVTYRIRIAEIYGNQSPYDAMKSNPAFFENRNIHTTIYQFPTASRPFKTGSRYAWKVDAYLNNVYISESEIWEFSFTESETNQTSANFSSNTRAQKHLVQDDKATVNNQPIQLASLKIVPGLWLNQDTTPNTTSIEKTAVQFSGNARLSAGMANRVASFSELPKNQGMAELNPVLTCYGLPFATNFLLSSFQDPNRQRINNFGFNFDFNRLHEGLTTRLNRKIEELIRSEAAVVSGADTPEMNRLRDPENLKNNLKQFGMISGAEKFFMGIRSLGIGTNYPMYSEYTLSGVPVTGVNIEINPGVLYAAFAGIGNQRGIDNLAYKRSLYAGRGGFGKKEGPHVYLTGLYVKDHEGSIRLDSASHPLAPRANYVFGTEVKLNFFEDKLSLQGEGAVAVLTRDTREPEFEHENIPGFLKNIIDPRISTSVDYSYSGKLAYNYNASATMVSLGIKMVGPGYTSLGVPNLRTDQFGYEAKIDQRLFKRRTSVGTFFKQYNDNLIKWKRSTTTTTAYGVNLRLNFRRLPFLRLSYSPYSQENDDINPLRKVNNTTTVYTAMTGYSYKLGDLISSTSFTFSGQQGKTHGIGDYRTHSFMITEAVSLTIPLSFTASWGLIKSNYGLENSRFNNIDLGASAQITDRWSCMAGVNLAAEKGRNNRKGFYINLSISPLKGIGIDLRAEQNIYTEKQETLGGYHEFIFSVTLISVW